MDELVFEVTQEADGGFVAEAIGESIITEADTWEELRTNVRQVVQAFYFDGPRPRQIRLHLVRDEVLASPHVQHRIRPFAFAQQEVFGEQQVGGGHMAGYVGDADVVEIDSAPLDVLARLAL